MYNVKTVAIALAVGVTAFLCFIIWFSDVWVAHWVAAAVVIGVGVYYGVLFFLQKFVDKKLKPLYTIIGKNRVDSKSNINLIEGEIRAWAEKSRSQMETLKSMENYRKEFLGNVSHELKTPLFSLQGYVDTLIEGVDDVELQKKYLSRCDKNIERLINIVKDLEDISKLEDQSMVLYKSDFDVLGLFKEVADGIGNLAEDKNIKININSKGPLMVNADRDRIEQVAINLLSNAVKYNKEGGKVEVQFEDMFDKVIIKVIDTGVGIEKEHLNRVFERFYRIDKARSRDAGGTGLGLAIVKHIIEAHAEQVNLTSVPNVGTTFFFTLHKPI